MRPCVPAGGAATRAGRYTVSAATSFGLFVQLDGLYVEGLVHITELGGEYYRFDEARQELRGERSGVRYGVGARVRVQVSRVDLDARKIDFRLVREDGGATPRTQQGQAGSGRTGRKGRSANEYSAQDELSEIQELDRQVRRGARDARTGSKAERHPAAEAGGRGGKPAAGKKAPSRKSARNKR